METIFKIFWWNPTIQNTNFSWSQRCLLWVQVIFEISFLIEVQEEDRLYLDSLLLWLWFDQLYRKYCSLKKDTFLWTYNTKLHLSNPKSTYRPYISLGIALKILTLTWSLYHFRRDIVFGAHIDFHLTLSLGFFLLGK